MKKLLTLLLATMISAVCAQKNMELAPGIQHVYQNSSDDSLNLFYSFSANAFLGEYGAESDGNTIYATQWLSDSLAAYDMSGNLIEKFTIYGVEKVRDLAYDGQYYYGSPSEFYFYVLDLDNKIAVDTVFTSFRIRGMAYDPAGDVLWASEHWSPMFYKMDKQGNILDSWLPSGVTMDAISGLAYDNLSMGGPFLWGFSQDSTGAVIVKYDIAGQAQTGNMIDVSGLVTDPAYAGGLFLEEMEEASGYIIGGVIQNQLHFGLGLDYANALVGLDEKDGRVSALEVFPNPAHNTLSIRHELRTGIAEVLILNQRGQIEFRDRMQVADKEVYVMDVSQLQAGVYFVHFRSEGLNMTSKFVKAR